MRPIDDAAKKAAFDQVMNYFRLRALAMPIFSKREARGAYNWTSGALKQDALMVLPYCASHPGARVRRDHAARDNNPPGIRPAAALPCWGDHRQSATFAA